MILAESSLQTTISIQPVRQLLILLIDKAKSLF